MSEHLLRVDALGPLRAWVDEEEVDLGAARQRAVFAVLALRGSRQPVSRAELIEAIWGEHPPASAAGSVHTYISGLRQVLDPNRTRWSTDGLLVSDAAGYQVRLAEDALDVAVFEKRCRAARAHAKAGNAAGAVAGFDSALALWRGEALSGIAGPFAEAQRHRLGEAKLAATEQRANGRLELGMHADLIPELSILVREHPLRESLWHTLMIALHRSNRTGEALDAYERIRTILRTELSATPCAELVDLHRRILTADPVLGGFTGSELLSVRPKAPHAPPSLHGRPAEQDHLRRMLDELGSGRGNVVWIEGEAGVGKSALLTTVLNDLTGSHLAWAAATEHDRDRPFQTLLDSLGAESSRSGEAPGTVTPTAWQLLSHIDALCARAPMVLVLEDLQWADEATLLLCHRLAVATRRLPLLLITTARPAPKHPDLAKLRRAVETRGYEVLSLPPLGPDAVRKLVSAFVGARLGPELDLFSASHPANPGHVLATIKALGDAGAIEVSGGSAELRVAVMRELPRPVTTAIEKSLQIFSDDTKKTLTYAALLGIEFDVAQVAAVLGRSTTQLIPPLTEILDAAIVVESGSKLAFRHRLLHAAIYQSVESAERRSRHRSAAEALARLGAAPEQVADQLVAAIPLIDDWVIDWVAGNHEALTRRTPGIAEELLCQVVQACPQDDVRQKTLATGYAVAQLRLRAPLPRLRETGSTATGTGQNTACSGSPDRGNLDRHYLDGLGVTTAQDARVDHGKQSRTTDPRLLAADPPATYGAAT
ncbi:BTAD domain-containing putative transcriptional regulator [Amycolatopsis sp. cg5]|uniref:BTAD domain-containing putative transcriptional regulator n=1 Tax=Amycolatopsis sp. cg5 TaxID=3238802 RepID=UPI00352575D6